MLSTLDPHQHVLLENYIYMKYTPSVIGFRAGLDPSLGKGETANQKFLTTATSVTCALTSLTGMAATSREAW